MKHQANNLLQENIIKTNTSTQQEALKNTTPSNVEITSTKSKAVKRITTKASTKTKNNNVLVETRRREALILAHELGLHLEKLLSPIQEDIMSTLKKLPQDKHRIFSYSKNENRTYMLTLTLAVDDPVENKDTDISTKKNVAADAINNEDESLSPTNIVSADSPLLLNSSKNTASLKNYKLNNEDFRN